MQITRFTSANALVLTLVLGGSWALGTPQEPSRRVVAIPQDAALAGGGSSEDLQAIPHSRRGIVPIGSIVAHYFDQQGAASLGALRELGFAVCNGTTPGFQGIDDPVIIAPTPNLNDTGRFLRGADPGYTGVMQDDATDASGMSVLLSDPGHDHLTLVSDFVGSNNGADGGFASSYLFGNYRRAYWDNELTGSSGLYHTRISTTGMSASVSSPDTETRPNNMSVLWIMRVK